MQVNPLQVIFTTTEAVPITNAGYPREFMYFHLNNPHIYQHLVELTHKRMDAGHKRGSIKQMFEVLRWEYDLTTTDNKFKLNNNYTAWYSRLLMDHIPRFNDFFELRKLNKNNYSDNKGAKL